MTEAFGGRDISALTLEGVSLKSQVREAITSAIIKRTIDGAPTLTLSLLDPHLTLLRSGIFNDAVLAEIDGYVFDLVQVKKNGRGLTCTFEDAAVVALRRRDNPRKIAAGAMTRVQFVKTLVNEVPWIRFVSIGTSEVTRQELSRGTVLDEDATTAQIARALARQEEGDAEDTWTATGRLMADVRWRRFIRGPSEFVVASDHGLLQQTVGFRLSERDEAVNWIDFDYDAGKVEATATAEVWAERWTAKPGSRGVLSGLGPADGDDWLVAEIERSLFSKLATIRFVQALPSLPEPEGPEGQDDDGLEGEITLPDGSEETTFLESDQGFQWPVEGRVTSPFGPRGGRNHDGIDIAVPVGTYVGASADGVCTFAGEVRGYGYMVDITHKRHNVLTRYAHLSIWQVERGAHVSRGDVIGVSGGAQGHRGSGNSRGPHVHFEIRRLTPAGSTAVDPRPFLP